jgi:hypothetical protein
MTEAAKDIKITSPTGVVAAELLQDGRVHLYHRAGDKFVVTTDFTYEQLTSLALHLLSITQPSVITSPLGKHHVQALMAAYYKANVAAKQASARVAFLDDMQAVVDDTARKASEAVARDREAGHAAARGEWSGIHEALRQQRLRDGAKTTPLDVGASLKDIQENLAATNERLWKLEGTIAAVLAGLAHQPGASGRSMTNEIVRKAGEMARQAGVRGVDDAKREAGIPA